MWTVLRTSAAQVSAHGVRAPAVIEESDDSKAAALAVGRSTDLPPLPIQGVVASVIGRLGVTVTLRVYRSLKPRIPVSHSACHFAVGLRF